MGLSLKDSPASFDPSEVAGYDVATGTWTSDTGYDAGYDADNEQDFAETEQL
jgi:DNA-directed RNA polymerase subunit alpha